MNRGYASDEYMSVYEGARWTGTTLLKREIVGTDCYDFFSVYPFSTFSHDMFTVSGGAITTTVITDPLHDFMSQSALTYNADVYKQHAVVNLKEFDFKNLPENHQRNIKKNIKNSLYVEVCMNPSGWAGPLFGIYSNLIKRHNITGITKYSVDQLQKLLNVPGAVLLKTMLGSQILNLSLFYINGYNAYYHISAQTSEGYEYNSNFIMMLDAITFFKSMGLDMLEIGATPDNVENSGLWRFKSGFSTEIRSNYIIKRIHNQAVYDRLVEGKQDTGFFPLYRN